MIEERFFASLIHCFFIAFGVILGGTLIGSVGAFATGEAPFTEMGRLAKKLRIWAIVAAIGGTFDAIENLENSLGPDGSALDIFKQALLILSAVGGVKSAILIISWLIQEEV